MTVLYQKYVTHIQAFGQLSDVCLAFPSVQVLEHVRSRSRVKVPIRPSFCVQPLHAPHAAHSVFAGTEKRIYQLQLFWLWIFPRICQSVVIRNTKENYKLGRRRRRRRRMWIPLCSCLFLITHRKLFLYW